jgi:hypothetical protein
MHKRIFVTIATIIAAYGAAAAARSTPALLGRPVNGSQYSCMNANRLTGAVRNDCAVVVDWTLGLPLDSNGAHSGAVTVNAPDRLQTSCRLVTLARNGTGVSSTPFLAPPSAQAFVDITFPQVNTPSSGLMFVECFLGPSAQVIKNDHLPN